MRGFFHLVGTIGLILSFTVQAKSEFAPLMENLAAYHSIASMAADVRIRTENQNGKGKNAFLKQGEIIGRVNVSDSGMGIQLGEGTILALQQESRAKKENANIPTPLSEALYYLSVSELMPVFDPVFSLKNNIQSYAFESMTALENGNRELHFKVSKKVLSKEQKKYFKKFKGRFVVVVDAKFHPIESRFEVEGKGRIFLVVKFAFSQSITMQYTRSGEKIFVSSITKQEENSGLSEYFRQKTQLDIRYTPSD